MLYKWLHQTDDANHVIVFFNGWGFNEDIVGSLTTNPDTDVLVVSDYTSLETALPELNHYAARTIIAWSFGVANYTVWQQNQPDIFDLKVAVNGTMQGICRSTGIAEAVVQHTIDTLSVDSFFEFQKRCLDSSVMKKSDSKPNIPAKKIELQNILDRNYVVDETIKWDVVWISKQDKIFPTKNQLEAWNNYTPNLIKASHAPFEYWLNWHNLLPRLK